MKINMMMLPQTGLAFACGDTALPCGGRAILAADLVSRRRQEKSAQIKAGRLFVAAAAAEVAAGVAGAPAFAGAPALADAPALAGGSYAPTKHVRIGGLRGPHPWRKPPVIT
ncbi:hypothetical protein [Streptosporangium pseudovulgare]|uniref:Uncharacterized protein n=1 Tax=Streptosporangium pseudovulgare TaxID=35765 RepID=A0ABQ2RDX7_9ACTN|nr:hypothetical protein [Streptosporangium pseudovulgare]GGQ21751.1 hypothetical protein GCM10010140_60130 [Streptosporangium pseudovulgare]